MRRCHAGQHFHVHTPVHPDAAFLHEGQGIGERIQVHASHTDVDRIEAFGHEGIAQHRHIVGVRRLLRRFNGQFPPMNNGVHELHRKIGSFDEPHFDGCSAAFAAFLRPFGEVRKPAASIGKIGLKHDSGAVGEELVAVKKRLEHVNRQLKVLVLLHVQIDEGARRRCQPIHREKFLHGVVHGCAMPVRRVQPDYRGDLEGHVIHVRAFDEFSRGSHSAIGFPIPHDCLAQQIDVQSRAILAKRRDGIAQFVGRGIHNQISHQRGEHLLRRSCRELGSSGRDRPANLCRG